MKRFGVGAIILMMFVAGPALAAGGADIAMQGTASGAPACSSCHGATGEGQPALAIPRLAGQNAGYIEHQLASFADGMRANDVMGPIATALSKTDRKSVAAYYAGLKPSKPAVEAPGNADVVNAGAVLAARGDWSKALPACSQCHTMSGLGVDATFPRLAGQNAAYIAAQLDAWQKGTRRSDPMGLMSGIAKKLDAQDVAAVAAYYASVPVSGAPVVEPASDPFAATAPGTVAQTFAPPPESSIPNDDFGKVVRLGENIFQDPQHYASEFVGNTLNCSNCHIDRGRQAGSAPMWAAYVSYPAYRAKNKRVNTFEERLQGCFKFSMNGKAPPLGSKTLVALETYSYFLAKGAPTGVALPGRGYPALKAPARPFDYARGQKVYARSCALCHGANGEGQVSANGTTVFPALWGQTSFNWGAGMGDIKNAAAFIKANMPFSQGNTLTDQEAWDVAAFVDSHERPQDPRFTGSVAETRAKYHDGPTWMYGRTIDGVLLGEKSPPPGLRGP